MTTLDSTEQPAQRRFDPLLYGSLALGVVSLFVGFVAASGEDSDVRGWVIVSVAFVLIGLAVWRWVVQPRLADGAAHETASLVLGVLAFLTAIVFWTGLPYALGPAAIALGTVTRARGGSTQGLVAVVLGALGIVAATVILILDAAT
jgi:hypothetical protein